jgi:RimJ/RimL family protein N-acetyltransferase
MAPIETDRLVLRELTVADAPFILKLVNAPSWLRFIGDRGIRTLADAESYLLDGPMAMYRQRGFGLWLTCLKADGLPIGSADGLPIGLCGLIKRDALDDVDIGFAFLPAYGGRGYAQEAATAALAYGSGILGLARIVAITLPENDRSIRLLERLGFAFERMVQPIPDGPMLRLFARGFSAARCGS